MNKFSFFTTLVTIFIFSLMLHLGGCTHDACKTRNVVCKNDGTCKDGDCICVAGYEGDSCQFRVNEKFDSRYACIRTALITKNGTTLLDDNDDTLRVKALNDKFKIKFYSIRDSIYEVINADVSGNYVAIPTQTVHNIVDYKFYGSGSLNEGVLTLTLFEDWIDLSGNIYTAKRTYVGNKFD